jgi:hypothetical protein
VLIAAELTANAGRHGRVPGRDFHLRTHAPAGGRCVRVEVTDIRAERLPGCPDCSGGILAVAIMARVPTGELWAL